MITLFTLISLGTRIVYERAFMMGLRNSPLAKSPPANLPAIPGVTIGPTADKANNKAKDSNGHRQISPSMGRKVPGAWAKCCIFRGCQIGRHFILA
jgi:hypothetical protein